MKDKMSEEDKEAVRAKCQEVISWLAGNQTAEKEEFEQQQKELEKICTPIVTKLYQAAGGAPGLCHLSTDAAVMYERVS